jgi:hypothetical protein
MQLRHCQPCARSLQVRQCSLEHGRNTTLANGARRWNVTRCHAFAVHHSQSQQVYINTARDPPLIEPLNNHRRCLHKVLSTGKHLPRLCQQSIISTVSAFSCEAVQPTIYLYSTTLASAYFDRQQVHHNSPASLVRARSLRYPLLYQYYYSIPHESSCCVALPTHPIRYLYYLEDTMTDMSMMTHASCAAFLYHSYFP